MTCLCRQRREGEVDPQPTLNLGARMGWAVNNRLRPFYTRKRQAASCTGGWVSHGAGMDDMENLIPARI